MSASTHASGSSVAPFRNEPYADFRDEAVASNAAASFARLSAGLGAAHLLLLDGEWVDRPEHFESVNPSMPSQVVSRHAKATVEDARTAVQSAAEAFSQWSQTPPAQRAALAFKVAALMRQRKMDLDALLVMEAGKSWVEAEADVAEAIDFCEYYGREMLRISGSHPTVPQPNERNELAYIPLGVGVIIPPWNFPLAILCGMTIAALVTGNTVVLKPSSDTPLIAVTFVKLLLEAGLPPKAIQLLTGPGAAIGDALVENPKTRFVSFTGSKAVGLRVNELAAKPQPGQIWIKRVIAEMGGKDAIIVDAEADLDAAVSGILASAFGYSGQKCSACSRAIVDASVYDTVLAMLKDGAEDLQVGTAETPGIHLGPVINERARRNILNYIETGRAEARLLSGGEAIEGEGYLIEPTVFVDVPSSAKLFQEEVFGPVLAVTKAADFDDALRLANDTEYGLTGAIYSRNPEKIARARRDFHVGNLYVNRKCTGALVGSHPFGGFNMSGTDSKAGGPEYLLLFMQAKSISTRI
ncbi:MAG: L-glutamate gamma-semialdehyde dehydrogenase [Bryobacterales bacterium]|nr:L-glutamate gamma-semialdehyde dehydrogenase [Bryobacterales bacterium]